MSFGSRRSYLPSCATTTTRKLSILVSGIDTILTLRRFKTETIEEVFRFYRDEIEFCLVRHYFLQPLESYVSMETKQQPSFPLDVLPSWEALTPVDQQKRWFLHVKAHVMQDNKPDEIRKAQDQLLAVRRELEGVFDFRGIDRKVHDTRVMLQAQGVQQLPQKVTIGK